MTLSHDKKLLASCTLDDFVKIIDVTTLEHRVKDDEFDEEVYEASISQNLKPNHGKQDKPERKAGNEEDWESENDSDSDMEDSSDDDKPKKDKKKDVKLNPKNATLGATKKMVEDQHRKDFFDDL